ncbi:1-phosphofructokinase family hexose kinase [Paracoccus aerodenitrificans]|uniref:1-phosphofructokinase family hexose kinase n=1 Tax=Paracoccus aerodenitrificans TaxID=3017781 RepID=UPI0022F026BC|nr:hexose kinase [Paracoccus aerodenitrificans]WBU64454.1 hexose kinase [Paracoccus aerodenitrificans]
MTQAAIVTVTLNPALDVSTGADRVEPDVKLRCDAPVYDPGGGGINVSRAIAAMGGVSTPLVALGGAIGQRMEDMMRDAGLDPVRFEAPGETRQSIAVTDRATGQQYRFTMPGPEWSPVDVETSLERIAAFGEQGYLVLSGSNPPGVPADYAGMLAGKLRGADMIVDTSGDALRAMADGGYNVAVLRMDSKEAEWLGGKPLKLRSDSAAFAASLIAAQAAQSVIVARGSDGNILVTPDAAWHAEAADIQVISKVGAGDSFVAGYALGMARGLATPDALGLGAAMASATCMTPATQLCRAEDVEELYTNRVVTRL